MIRGDLYIESALMQDSSWSLHVRSGTMISTTTSWRQLWAVVVISHFRFNIIPADCLSINHYHMQDHWYHLVRKTPLSWAIPFLMLRGSRLLAESFDIWSKMYCFFWASGISFVVRPLAKSPNFLRRRATVASLVPVNYINNQILDGIS